MNLNIKNKALKEDMMETVKISNRLMAAADMVSVGNTVADIGTDHGYLPIYLVQNNISGHVIAMDVNKGPLSRATANISQMGLADRIETRLSDGLSALKKGEAGTITICGMGGKLMARIISDGFDRIDATNELILSPQSEISQFREFLVSNGFETLEERMLIEEGKFYVLIRCRLTGKCDESEQPEQISEVHAGYGRYLLEHRNEALKEFLLKEKAKYLKLKQNLLKAPSENADIRISEIDHELKCIEEGLEYYEIK